MTSITVSDFVLEQEQVGDSSGHTNSKRIGTASKVGVLQVANDTITYRNIAEPSARGGGASGGEDIDAIAIMVA